MRYLIKYATRERPELFKETIKNIYETISTRHFEILVSADTNDQTMNNSEIINFICPYTKVTLIFGDSLSKVDAINRDIETARDWDILINMSDDMKFVVRGWDLIIDNDVIKMWGSSMDWFAHYSDGYVGHRLPTMSIMGREYYNRTNYIYHPDYKSFSCDAEAMYVAQMLERYHYFGDDKVMFKHHHPANDRKVKNDELYRVSSLATDHDLKVYWKRLNSYFDLPNAKVIPFKEHIGRNI